jgi:hypothetical protein
MKNDITYTEALRRKGQLERALDDVMLALNHDEYMLPFKFVRPNKINEGHLKHSSLKAIINKCEINDIGFDPNLISQHIERVALERFNKIVLDELNEINVRGLMEIRHEIELLQLNERKNHYDKELEIINSKVVALAPGPMLNDEENLMSDAFIINNKNDRIVSMDNITSIKKSKNKE